MEMATVQLWEARIPCHRRADRHHHRQGAYARGTQDSRPFAGAERSIFVNILRVVVWVLAVATVLQPVFGVNPTTLFTALGIGGLAVSLGLKDTIANVIGGFGLMLGHVIQPGDYVSVSGTKGVVKDINWRQTIVRERNGNEMVIPNSILNTASLEKARSDQRMPGAGAVHREGRHRSRSDGTRHHRRRREGDEGPREYAIPHKGEAHRILTVWHRRHGLCLRKKAICCFRPMADAVARAIANAEYLEHGAIATDEQ